MYLMENEKKTLSPDWHKQTCCRSRLAFIPAEKTRSIRRARNLDRVIQRREAIL